MPNWTKFLKSAKDWLLGKPATAGYRPAPWTMVGLFSERRPTFTLYWAERMSVDPRVTIGLSFVKGPILSLVVVDANDEKKMADKSLGQKIIVRSPDKNVAAFVAKNLARFWANAANTVLRAVEYGNSCGELTYCLHDDGLIYYDKLLDRHVHDCRVLTREGTFAGITVRSGGYYSAAVSMGAAKLLSPKAWWHTYDRRYGSWYGRSRLVGAFDPWYTKWMTGGAIDIRNLWFYKNAYNSGVMRFPIGKTTLADGTEIDNRDLARQMMEEEKTGAVIALPNAMIKDTSTYQWTREPAAIQGTATEIREYPRDLDGEILEGLQVPPEVVEASGTGAYAGRRVPQDGFYSGLKGVVTEVIDTWREQCGDPLVRLNWGRDVHYEVEVEPLLPPEQSQQQEQGQDQQGDNPLAALMGGGGGKGGGPSKPDAPRQDQPGQNGQSRVPAAPARLGQPRATTVLAAVGTNHGTATAVANKTTVHVPTHLALPAVPARDQASLAPVDRIIAAGLDLSAGVAEELRAKLAERLVGATSPAGMVAAARQVLVEFEPQLADVLSDGLLAAWLLGTDATAAAFPADLFTQAGAIVEPFTLRTPLRFPAVDAAARDLASRGVVSADQFRSLDADAKRHAFTIAADLTEQTVERIRDAAAELVATGPKLERFNERLDTILSTGDTPLSPAHRETIFRNAVGSAYRAGVEETLAHPLVQGEFPYLEHATIPDGRRSDVCAWLARNGIDGTAIYRADDPLYAQFRPPSHMNCRTTLLPLSLADAAKRGCTEAQDWLASGTPPARPFRMLPPPVHLVQGSFYGQGGGVARFSLVRRPPVRLALATDDVEDEEDDWEEEEDDGLQAIIEMALEGEIDADEFEEMVRAFIEERQGEAAGTERLSLAGDETDSEEEEDDDEVDEDEDEDQDAEDDLLPAIEMALDGEIDLDELEEMVRAYAEDVTQLAFRFKGPRTGSVREVSSLGEIPTSVRAAGAYEVVHAERPQSAAASKPETQHKPTATAIESPKADEPTAPRTSPPQLSEKAQRAKAAHQLVDKDIQRYAEEHNEPRFAKAIGGVSFPNSEAVDVVIAGPTGSVAHGIEVKTLVNNRNGKITMKRDAMVRKAKWSKDNKASIHTVVLDDQDVFNANGPGQHDESKRKIYYRRGVGSFRVATMHQVKDLEELKQLMDLPKRKLPKAAQPAGGGKK